MTAVPAFHVVIPARMASTRLPRKPLADIGGLPMVVRVARQALAAGAQSVTVAVDHPETLAACRAHGIDAIMTAVDHPSGSDRLAEACVQLGLQGDAIVVNVQGDEPLIDPALVQACAATLAARADCQVATIAHPIRARDEFDSPHVVKVVLDADGRAGYFSRAPIPHWRDRPADAAPDAPLAGPAPALRHVGLYAYRAGYLREFPRLAPSPLEQAESLEQLRVLWHGGRIAVHVTPTAPPGGVDTAADLERVRAAVAAIG